MDRPTVLIIGYENTTSLALVRSLHKKYSVWISTEQDAHSRLWERRIRKINPLRDRRFQAIIPVGFRHTAPLVYAGCDRLPWKDWHVFVKAHDKSYLSEPWSGRYPCAVKPRSWCGATQVYRCSTPEERDEAIRRIRALDDDPPLSDATPLTQDWWTGEIYDVVLLAVDGKMWGEMVQKRVITNPSYPHGGPGCLNVTIDPKEPYARSILKKTRRIVRKIRWTGPAQLEYRSGHLVEMNAKLWGTYPLTIKAGYDLSEAIARLAMGENLPKPPRAYKPGIWCGFWPTMLKQKSAMLNPKAWATALESAIKHGDLKPEIKKIFLKPFNSPATKKKR